MTALDTVRTARLLLSRVSCAGVKMGLSLASVVAATSMTFAAPIHGQVLNQDWEFRSVPSADLLFHGLAVVGLRGFSSLPLYDRDYAERIRAAKEARGIAPTSLDREAARFREAFESDSTFELLHFLPLYFGTVQPTTMLDVLSEIASGSGPRSATEEAAFASIVLASVLRSRTQKDVLGAFADALEEEWDVFLQAYAGEYSDRQRTILAGASRIWTEQVAPAVASFLNTRGMFGGTIIVSEALGPEGRVFTGDPGNADDNFFAISSAHNSIGLGISAYLVKELCYPVASGVVEALGMSWDRVTAEHLSGRLAVRCGAELLDASDAGLASEYRATFLAAAAASGISAPTFEMAYPVDQGVVARLKRTLRDN